MLFRSMRRIITILFASLLLLTTACVDETEYADNPRGNFEALWRKAIRDARLPEDDHSDTCSMCGKFCAVRSMNKALAGEYIDIL